MRNKILQLMFLLMSGALLIMLPCCTKENNGGNNGSGDNNSGGNSGGNSEPQSSYPWDNYQPTSNDIQLENKLLNTSWNWKQTISYHSGSGNTSVETPSTSGSDFRYSELSYKAKHGIYIDGKKKGYWWIENGVMFQYFGKITNTPDPELDYSAYHSGQLNITFGFYLGTYGVGNVGISQTIITLTETTYTWRKYTEYGYETYYYTRASGGGGGGGNSSYELPDVGFYYYDAYTNSLTVNYKIYNNSDAHVNSARIYYGTTSNPTSSVSADIAGVVISARITGLSSGTKYYVKCKATGPGGTTTTSVTPCMTQ